MKLLKELKPYAIILVIVVVIRTFITTPIIVEGNSMNETLKNNEILLLNKYDKSFERFEIIVFKHKNSKLIKRIIGLPGESVYYKDGNLYINNEIIEDSFSSITNDFDLKEHNIFTIPEDKYFVLGDNRNDSTDSRVIGLIDKDSIIGTVSYSLWPIKTVK